jgi:tRNA(His) 5'-end guanylyltransferase
MKHDEFGDRMKALEGAFTSTKVSPDKWMAVRTDGRGFSKFTKGFTKPFDGHLANIMITTTKALVKETHASVGYTQSDEITLLYPPTEGERIFGGKVSKINSVFASIATAHFNIHMQTSYPRVVDKLAYFDCRVWEVPTDIEASNTLLWRVQDARKNSISSYFRWTVGHKQMQNLSGEQMIQYLKDNGHLEWDHLHNMWKYGTYVKPVAREEYLDEEQLEKIPEHKRPTDLKVMRTTIQTVDLGYFGDLSLEQRASFVK